MKFSIPKESRKETGGFSLGQTHHSNEPKKGKSSGGRLTKPSSGRGAFTGSPPSKPSGGSFSPPTMADAKPAKK